MSRYTLRDGFSTTSIDAPDVAGAEQKARAWVAGGSWGEIEQTIWIDVTIQDDDGDNVGRVKVALQPPEPECDGDDGHDWQAPHALVGGVEENPGVWGHNGGVAIAECCMVCGCKRTTDTWAQDPETGEQGLESVAYEIGAFDLTSEPGYSLSRGGK